MDRDPAADIGLPLLWLGPGVALRGCKKQDVAVEPSRNESSREPTVLFHDLDDRCDLTFVEVRDGILLVGINGVGTAFAYSVPAPSPCQSWVQSADALKRFQSHAEAALLSGKQLGIAYNICDPDGQKIKHIWALSIGG